jgi:hypothetical protein
MSAIVHPDVSTDWIRATLSGDATLMALTVTQNGVARPVQGVHYLVAPQESENPYPCIIINQPILRYLPQNLRCNGRFITSATFLQDVRCVGRDVEPDDAGLRAIRARVKTLLEGQTGTVTGGLVTSTVVNGFPTDSRDDKGSYIYSETMITFQIATQLT